MRMNGPPITRTLHTERVGTSFTSKVYTISEVPPHCKWELTLGFGNVSFIGFLPIDLYRSVDLSKEDRGREDDFHFITEQT
jgi:hypothetical protein